MTPRLRGRLAALLFAAGLTGCTDGADAPPPDPTSGQTSTGSRAEDAYETRDVQIALTLGSSPPIDLCDAGVCEVIIRPDSGFLLDIFGPDDTLTATLGLAPGQLQLLRLDSPIVDKRRGAPQVARGTAQARFLASEGREPGQAEPLTDVEIDIAFQSCTQGTEDCLDVRFDISFDSYARFDPVTGTIAPAPVPQ